LENFDAGDLSGDGIPDVVVANGYDFNTVDVIFGRGDGTFGAPIVLTADPTGFAGPGSVRIADFNNDGHPDFASDNLDEPTVSVFLGDGKGHFAAPVLSTFTTGGTESALYASDLNRDGVLDLVVAFGYSLGRGNGSFQAQQPWSVGQLVPITVGDFDGDNIPDVVGNAGTTNPETQLSLLVGKGDGTFAAAKAVPVGSPVSTGVFAPFSLFAADVDGDDNTDIITGLSEGHSSILFASGNGTFLRSQGFTAAGQAVTAASNGATTRVLLSGSGGPIDSLECGP
jgi:FG-GAP-like repeat